MAVKQKIAAKYSSRGNVWSPFFPQCQKGHRTELGRGLMQPTSKFNLQITCTQQHRGCWCDWPSSSWVSSVGCPTQNNFQAWEGLKSRRMGPENPWELTLPEPLQKDKMISLKYFLFLRHALHVLGVYLYCEQPEMSAKPYHNIYLDQITEKYNVMCSLSSKSIAFSYFQTWHLQFPTHRLGAFWRKYVSLAFFGVVGAFSLNV